MHNRLASGLANFIARFDHANQSKTRKQACIEIDGITENTSMYLEREMGVWISLPTSASLRRKRMRPPTLGKADRPRDATSVHREGQGRSRKVQGWSGSCFSLAGACERLPDTRCRRWRRPGLQRRGRQWLLLGGDELHSCASEGHAGDT